MEGRIHRAGDFGGTSRETMPKVNLVHRAEVTRVATGGGVVAKKENLV